MCVPLTAHFEARFHIPELLRSGIAVELWDITNFYFSHIRFSGAVERAYIVKFDDFAALKRRLEMTGITQTVFILLLRLSFRTLKLYLLFSRNGCRTYTFVEGLLPRARSVPFLCCVLRRYLANSLNLEKLTDYFLNLLPWVCKQLNLIKEYDTVFVSGSVATALYERKSRLVQTNYIDYDLYMENKENGNKIVDGDYCVFLDGNLANDSDNKVLGFRTVTASQYFQAMKSFFDRIEKSHRTNVVIAASPKSEYNDGIFGFRQVFKQRTHDLIKNCSFVIADYSTAVAYAVLYQKPIIFYYTQEMKKLSYFTYIMGLAEALDCSLYNIDLLGDNDPLLIKPVNEERYDDYKYDFLTSKESETRRTRDILLDHFKGFKLRGVQEAIE